MVFLLWKNAKAMLERKISDYIEHFYKVNKGAFLLSGARQIGKTYSIRKFAEKHFSNFIEINFVENPDAVEIFSAAKNSADILLRLSEIAVDAIFALPLILLFSFLITYAMN